MTISISDEDNISQIETQNSKSISRNDFNISEETDMALDVTELPENSVSEFSVEQVEKVHETKIEAPYNVDQIFQFFHEIFSRSKSSRESVLFKHSNRIVQKLRKHVFNVLSNTYQLTVLPGLFDFLLYGNTVSADENSRNSMLSQELVGGILEWFLMQLCLDRCIISNVLTGSASLSYWDRMQLLCKYIEDILDKEEVQEAEHEAGNLSMMEKQKALRRKREIGFLISKLFILLLGDESDISSVLLNNTEVPDGRETMYLTQKERSILRYLVSGKSHMTSFGESQIRLTFVSARLSLTVDQDLKARLKTFLRPLVSRIQKSQKELHGTTGGELSVATVSKALKIFDNEASNSLVRGTECYLGRVTSLISKKAPSNLRNDIGTFRSSSHEISMRIIQPFNRKPVEKTKSSSGLFGSARDKIMIYKERFELVRKRLLQYRYPSGDMDQNSGDKQLKITPLKNLLGTDGDQSMDENGDLNPELKIIFGFLRVISSGTKFGGSSTTGLVLEDLDGSVELMFGEEFTNAIVVAGTMKDSSSQLSSSNDTTPRKSGPFSDPPSSVARKMSAKQVKTALSAAKTTAPAMSPGLFTETSLVLCNGLYLGNGMFRVKEIIMPPVLKKQFWRKNNTPESMSIPQQINYTERITNEEMCLILSDVYLDSYKVLDKLDKLFSGYESVGIVPGFIILAGDFLQSRTQEANGVVAGGTISNSLLNSRLSGSKLGANQNYKLAFDNLIRLFSQHSHIARGSRVILVPGPGDCGRIRPVWSPGLNTALKAALSSQNLTLRIELVSNPSILRFRFRRDDATISKDMPDSSDDEDNEFEYDVHDIEEDLDNDNTTSSIINSDPRFIHKEMLIYRENLLSKFMRNLIVLPDSALAAAAAETISSHSNQSLITTTGTIGYNLFEEPNVHKHLALTILSQAHLSPFPPTVMPISWKYDSSMRLKRVPDALVLADRMDAYDIGGESSETNTENSPERTVVDGLLEDVGCKCLNPGPFAVSKYQFQVYFLKSGRVELSQVPE